MDQSELIYLLIAMLLVVVVGYGLARVRRNRVRDPHSGLTEVEEARRKILH
jgi:hypothetical protein